MRSSPARIRLAGDSAAAMAVHQNPGWRTVVGVVKDMRSRGPEEEARPEFFLPIAQAPDAAWTWIQRTMTLVARSRTGDASALTDRGA